MTTAKIPDVGTILNEYILARDNLFDRLHGGIHESVEDFRDRVWNGDREAPKWDWTGEEWNYEVEAVREVIECDGILFLLGYCNGRESWYVFDPEKVEHHEEEW